MLYYVLLKVLYWNMLVHCTDEQLVNTISLGTYLITKHYLILLMDISDIDKNTKCR